MLRADEKTDSVWDNEANERDCAGKRHPNAHQCGHHDDGVEAEAFYVNAKMLRLVFS